MKTIALAGAKVFLKTWAVMFSIVALVAALTSIYGVVSSNTSPREIVIEWPVAALEGLAVLPELLEALQGSQEFLDVGTRAGEKYLEVTE